MRVPLKSGGDDLTPRPNLDKDNPKRLPRLPEIGSTILQLISLVRERTNETFDTVAVCCGPRAVASLFAGEDAVGRSEHCPKACGAGFPFRGCLRSVASTRFHGAVYPGQASNHPPGCREPARTARRDRRTRERV